MLSQLLNNVFDWIGEHPILTVLIGLLLLGGSISISIHLGFETKLMPY